MTAHADTSCPGEHELAELLAQAGDPDRRRALTRHLAGCSHCRERMPPGATGPALFASQPTMPAPARQRTRDEVDDAGHPRGDQDDDQGDGDGDDASARPETLTGERIGRYELLERIGAGGMGVVYSAHDPELSRKVAIKLLGEGVDPSGQARLRHRLLREAQAMAQLAHPNVVAVHDVGSFRFRIFIAMELVAGQTLAAWLRAAPRAPADILAHFLAAGDGLAAAHAAGVVHRDFKPENVLVGDDGRIRVTDFGLALVASRSGPAAGPVPDAAIFTPAGTSSVGGFAGTPYYMAPEQHLGAATDERTDQFSFCVALHAALAGEHPFEGDSSLELQEAVTNGALRRIGRRRGLGRRVRSAITRGLSVDPAQRHPSMSALLDDLRPAPGRARPVLVAATALGAAAAVALLIAGEPEAVCRGGEDKLIGAWDPARAVAVQHAFATTRMPFAAAAYSQVSRVLDQRARDWVAMHREACEATRVRGEQSETLLELRMMCLDDRLGELRTLTEAFTTADAALVERAPRSVRDMPDASSCARARDLLTPVRPPAGPGARRRVAAMRAELAEVAALRQAGRAPAGLDRVRRLARAAAELRYRPLEGEVLLEQAEVEREAGDANAVAPALERAVWASEAGRDDDMAARAWIRLMGVTGHDQGHYAEALALRPRVTAVLERMHGDDELEGLLHLETSTLLDELQRQPEAQQEGRQALALFERRFGLDDLRVADALDALGFLAQSMGQSGRPEFERSLAIKRRVYGPAHPEHARALKRLGDALGREYRYPEARAALEESLAVLERALGPDHADVAKVAASLAVIREAQGDFEAALVLRRRAVAIGARVYEPDHPNYATYLLGLATTLTSLERSEEALVAYRAALAAFERKFGENYARAGLCRWRMAEALFQLHRHREAHDQALRALRIHQHLTGADDWNAPEALLLLGYTDLAANHPARAATWLEHAHQVTATPGSADPGLVAEISFALSRALVGAGRDRPRARTLALEAHEAMVADQRLAGERPDLERWLRRNGWRPTAARPR
ncbi:MAG TPA: serine/threonine-protein kinase [Kofleriaceae bacterium]|nr:serine/threonine-protein kinase [Kofleriaceae bacterium]